MKGSCALAVLLGAVVAGSAALATGQQAQPAPRPVAEAVRVHVVNVEVYVTGKDGRPVHGLEPEDFELLEDGKPVPITNFFAASVAAEAAGPATVTPPGGTGGGVVPGEQGLNLVIFVDGVNLTNVGRELVLKRLSGFVRAGLPHKSRVMVATFDLSLKKRCPFVTDPAAAVAALDALQKESTEGLFRKVTGAGDLNIEMEYDLEMRLLRALAQFVDSLAGLEGRTVLLYISDGFPTRGMGELLVRPDAAVYSFGPRRAFELFDMSTVPQSLAGWYKSLADGLRDQLGDVMRRANAGRVSFYTVNSFPERGWLALAARCQSDVASRATSMWDGLNRQQSLFALSGATGGQPLFASTSLDEALNGVTTDLATYYSLGYSPGHRGDGLYHTIAVRVSREDVRVRHRMAYLDKTEEQRRADRTTAALLGGGNDNPLDARVELGTPHKEGRKNSVPLTVYIPGQGLVLLGNGETHEGKVSIAIAVAKKNGSSSQVHHEVFPIKVPSRHLPAFLAQDATFAFTLLVEPGDTSVSVTARDGTGQIESVVVTDLAKTLEQS